MRRISSILLAGALALGSMFSLVSAGADTVGAGGLYVVTDGPSVWQESNGVDGLQTTATDQDGDGTAETGPDTQLA